MPLTDEAYGWLDAAGFRNYCFISYPYTGEPELDECAEKIRDEIIKELKYATGLKAPAVYIAKTDIPPGAEWPDDLRDNLCRSVAMVAILMGAYLRHEWCGIEWAAMEALGRARLPGTAVKPIIPVEFRKTELPPSVAVLQRIDISSESLLGKRYYSTKHFKQQVQRIVSQILEIAALVHKNGCTADSQLQLPKRSPFATVHVPVQPPPGRLE